MLFRFVHRLSTLNFEQCELNRLSREASEASDEASVAPLPEVEAKAAPKEIMGDLDGGEVRGGRIWEVFVVRFGMVNRC